MPQRQFPSTLCILTTYTQPTTPPPERVSERTSREFRRLRNTGQTLPLFKTPTLIETQPASRTISTQWPGPELIDAFDSGNELSVLSAAVLSSGASAGSPEGTFPDRGLHGKCLEIDPLV